MGASTCVQVPLGKVPGSHRHRVKLAVGSQSWQWLPGPGLTTMEAKVLGREGILSECPSVLQLVKAQQVHSGFGQTEGKVVEPWGCLTCPLFEGGWPMHTASCVSPVGSPHSLIQTKPAGCQNILCNTVRFCACEPTLC